MFTFRQHSEAALFASDLKFSISNNQSVDDVNSTFGRFLNANAALGGNKPEETLVILNMKLSKIVSRYKQKMQAMVQLA